MDAHLRKLSMWLQWISREKSGAGVTFRTVDLGAWRDIRPQWRVQSGRMRFQFQGPTGTRAFWVSSVEPAEDSLAIHFAVARGLPRDSLYVCWAKDCALSVRDNLWTAAQKWIKSHLPGCRILHCTSRPDRTHSISGGFLRVLLIHQNVPHLVLVASDTPTEEPSRLLTQALLWLTHLSTRRVLRSHPKVLLLMPVGQSRIAHHRSKFLTPDLLSVELQEYETADFRSVQPAPLPPEPVEDRDFRWPVLGPFRWSSSLARLLELAPDLIRRYPRFQDYDSLRLYGLEFARVLGSERDRLQFGVGGQMTELSETNFESLAALVREILYYRRPDTPDTEHPYYRMQSERWLEALILEDVPRLFPELTPECVYSQIPVYLGKDPGRVDILGVDNQGTLVVLELKVVEDPELPMQSLDYWGRVIEHNNRGDFERRGYFSGQRLTRNLPRIYLVSPVFSFHDSTERLLRFVLPDVEVWKIGINHDWRSAVRILNRAPLRCGDWE